MTTRMAWRRWVGGLLVFLSAVWVATGLLPQTARAQAGEARLIPDAATFSYLTVGDPADLMLEVTHPAGTVAILPEPGADWGDVELRDVSIPEVLETASGDWVTRQRLTVALFKPGTFLTPPLSVRVGGMDGSSHELFVSPLTITVSSVLTSAETPLRDLKAQADVAVARWLQVLVGVGVAGLVALGGWLLWRQGALSGLRARTPAEQALAELEHLDSAGLVRQGKYKEYYLGVSHTMRRYLAREFGVSAVDMTTRELRSHLRRDVAAVSVVPRLITLLEECDLVKFAQVTPAPEGASAAMAEARALVHDLNTAREATPASPEGQPSSGIGGRA